MAKPSIDLSLLVVFAVLSGVYGYVSYALVSRVDALAYQVILSIIALIIYLNVLRFVIMETYRLVPARLNEFLSYVLMYAITITIIVLPLFVGSREIIDAPLIRAIIIFFASILLAKYTIYMLLGPWHDIKQRFKERYGQLDHDYQPLVSVVIPAWNEGVGILDTVRSLLRSTYRRLEIIIINDGSTDDSDEKICAFLREHQSGNDVDIRLRYRYQQNGGKGAALNHAISIARGDLIVSIDADCFVDPRAVEEFVKVFRDPQVMAAVGNVKIGNRINTVGVVQYLEFLFSFYFKRADALLGAIYIIGGAAGAFRREVFEKIGGYSVGNITEDIELTVRIQDAGMKIEYASEAVVYTEGAADLRSLKKQRLRWKKGRFETFYKFRHLFFSRQPHHNKVLTWFIMPLSLLQELQLLLEIPFLVFLYVFSIVNNDYSSFLTCVLVVSTLFWVQFLFYDKSTRNWQFMALAPIGWLLFYLATYVEVTALVNAIRSYLFKYEVTWQRWNRQGVGVNQSS